MLGCSNYRLFHIQVAAVAVNGYALAEQVWCLQFHTLVLELSAVLVEHWRRSCWVGSCNDDVVSVEIEQVDSVIKLAVQKCLWESQFIVPQTLCLKGCVLRRIHEHLPDDWVAESLAYRKLDLSICRAMECGAGLGNKFGTCFWVMVNTQTCVQCEPIANGLAGLQISCYLVFAGIDLKYIGSCRRTVNKVIVCLAAVTVIVKSKCQAVALKQACTLPGWCTPHFVIWNKAEEFRCGTFVVTVVDPMVTPAVEDADCTGCLPVVVLNEQGCGSSGDILIGIDKRCALQTRLWSLETCDIYVGRCIPIVWDIIT